MPRDKLIHLSIHDLPGSVNRALAIRASAHNHLLQIINVIEIHILKIANSRLDVSRNARCR